MRTAYERLSKSDGISIKDYAKAIGLTYNTASMSLHRYRKRDFISSKRNGKETIFQLTERGKRFIEIIRKIENEAKTNL
jgi:predicted transcriptional regulator